jgi:tRNA-2-methylthio-N6-dimethylallyladenosine synthase
MNVADSQRVASALERLGYQASPRAEGADVIVLNTCVVRQSAEDKAVGRLNSLRPLKQKRPEVVVNLMGCLVGVKNSQRLAERFPFVDVFSPPSDPGPLIAHLSQGENRALEQSETARRFAFMDGDLQLPLEAQGKLVSAHVPVVYGCSHACTFCIIPYRRGSERSRPAAEIVDEIRSLVSQGVKEVTLLGQIVDRYGKDIPDGPDLAALLRLVHGVAGLTRIRFLTSHPNWMTDSLLETVAELPKVCPHIEVPVQAGDDEILARMKRAYSAQEYRELVGEIRGLIPKVSIATDVIIGFPGESAEQFQRTFDLLAELRLDVAHLARYSPRPGTVADRKMVDDVPDEEKWARFRQLEALQEGIVGEINGHYLGRMEEVLFETKVRGRWKGRTDTNKLVFVETDQDLRGQLISVEITWTGPWSMQGRLLS